MSYWQQWRGAIAPVLERRVLVSLLVIAGGLWLFLGLTDEMEMPNLGHGKAQYAACQGCQSFGCAVSAMPGTWGTVTPSLCFDAACNSRKVAQWRKASRDAAAPPSGKAGNDAPPRGTKADGKTAAQRPQKRDSSSFG